MTLTDPITTPEPVAAPERTLRHEPALDGLRGLAVAGVLLFHGGHLVGGYLGVDAFFVLSGFLITTLLLVEYGNNARISLSRFWVRRARRLLPALAGVLAAIAIYAAFIAQPGELPTIRGDGLSTLFYFANWHAITAGNDYFALFRSPSPLQHTWSLAIEEQFYVVWPLALVMLLGRGRDGKAAAKRVLTFALVLAAGSVVLAQLLYKRADPSRVYYGTDTRAAAILLGAALGAALIAWGPVTRERARRALEGVALLGVATLAVAWSHLSGSSNFLYRGGLLLCGISVVAVIAASVHPERGPVAKALSLKPLRGLGIISYGIYLWHWPIFVWLNEDRARLGGWPLFVLQCTVTLVISLLSYAVIERPIRHGAGSRRVMTVATPVTALALVAALILATPASSLTVIPAWIPGAHKVPSPSDKNWKFAMDSYRGQAKSGGARTRVLVFGDSVALTLAIKTPHGDYRSADMNGVAMGLLGCSLLPGNRIEGKTAYQQDPNCNLWPTLLAQTIAAFHPQIVATMLGPWELFDRQTTNGRENAGSPQITRELEDALSRLNDIVTNGGARLVVLDSPCYFPPKVTPGQQGKTWGSRTRVAWLNHVWRDVVAQHPKTATLGDLSGLLCPGGRPIERDAGNKYREDGIHFTPAGASLVWHWIDTDVVQKLAAPKPGS